MTVRLKTTDTLDVIQYTATSVGNKPVNLTGATVRFLMAKRGTKTPAVNAAAVIEDAINGKMSYALSETDTLQRGTFNAEFQVEFADGKRKTFPSEGYLTVNISANLDSSQPGSIEDGIIIKITEVDKFKEDITDEVALQKTRVDNLITSNPQPAEVQDIRNGLGGVNYPTAKQRIDTEIQQVTESLAQTATKEEVAAVASGSPKGAYETLVDLQTAHPTGDTGIYVVTADGYWYFWNGSAWTAGAVYQSTLWQNALTIQNQAWAVS